jgi:molybdate transport repressor ModE-like protein
MAPYAQSSAASRRLVRPERWLGIEFRHLAALEAIAHEGSFNRAARRLGYTQSAISQQIAALERAIGQRLVNRPGGSSPVGLTPAGDLLLHHAETIAARLAAAAADLSALERGDAGLIRIGTVHTLGGGLVPSTLRALSQRRPELAVELTELVDDGELLVALEHAELDLVITYLPLPSGPYEATALYSDDYVLVVRRKEAETVVAEASSEQGLAALQLIALNSPRAYEPFAVHFESLGTPVTFAYQAGSIRTLEGMVLAGLGAAVVPRAATDLLSADAMVVEPPCLEHPAHVVAAVRHAERVDDERTAEVIQLLLAAAGAPNGDKSVESKRH